MYHAKCLVSAAAVLVAAANVVAINAAGVAAASSGPTLVPLTSKFRNCSFQRDPLGVGYGLRQRRCAHRHERIQLGYRGRASCDRGAQHSLHSEADPGAPGGRPNLRGRRPRRRRRRTLHRWSWVGDGEHPGRHDAGGHGRLGIDRRTATRRPGHRRVLHVRGAGLPGLIRRPGGTTGPHRIRCRDCYLLSMAMRCASAPLCAPATRTVSTPAS